MNIVFLDIDGVLQPYDAEFRFLNLDRSIIDKLSLKYGVDYSKYSFYDVAAVYYDWDEQAVSRLRYILNETNSKIITSSDWRNAKDLYKIRDLLKIYELDNYWLDDNIILKYELGDTFPLIRAREIKHSIDKYNLDNFVILDDMKELSDYYPDNSVITNNIISIDNMNDCINILKRKK